MVSLWGRPWARRELLARPAASTRWPAVQLVQAGDVPSEASGCCAAPRVRVFAARSWTAAGSTSAAPGSAAGRWPGGHAVGLIGPWLTCPPGWWYRGFARRAGVYLWPGRAVPGRPRRRVVVNFPHRQTET